MQPTDNIFCKFLFFLFQALHVYFMSRSPGGSYKFLALLSLWGSVVFVIWLRRYFDPPKTLVCFTDLFSLSYSPQLSQACFQPQNLSYPSYYHQRPFFSGVAVLGLGRFSFIMVRWVKILFWFLELYWFRKGAIEVDYQDSRTSKKISEILSIASYSFISNATGGKNGSGSNWYLLLVIRFYANGDTPLETMRTVNLASLIYLIICFFKRQRSEFHLRSICFYSRGPINWSLWNKTVLINHFLKYRPILCTLTTNYSNLAFISDLY